MSEINARFEAAMDHLVADGPVKVRLVRAYVENLQGLSARELPEEAGSLYRDLAQAMQAVSPVGRASPVQASVQKMSIREATAHAHTIVELYRLLMTTERHGDHLKIVDPEPDPSLEPPAFLLAGS